MMLRDFTPSPDVAHVVQLYRVVHLHFSEGAAPPPKAYPPRPEHCLAFYPFDTESVRYSSSGKTVEHLETVLYGQFSEVTYRSIGSNFLVLQVIFWPGTLYRLTGIPASELNNSYLDARLIFGEDLGHINDQLREAAGYADMLRTINNFIRRLCQRRLKPGNDTDLLCKQMLAYDSRVRSEDLAAAAYLSQRQMRRQFLDRTGVSPSLYGQIIRFDRAFRMRNAHPDWDWLRIAMACDYHDYQHLAKAYKTFTGYNPNQFHWIENQAPERLLGLSENYYSSQ